MSGAWMDTEMGPQISLSRTRPRLPLAVDTSTHARKSVQESVGTSAAAVQFSARPARFRAQNPCIRVMGPAAPDAAGTGHGKLVLPRRKSTLRPVPRPRFQSLPVEIALSTLYAPKPIAP